MINWQTEKRPLIALAPMADMTDLPFCLMCKKFGAPIIFREMVSAEAMVRGNKKTLAMARIDDRERPVIQQIFGNNPETMAKAAQIIEEQFHPDGIDINMGCPVYKLTSNFHGAYLIRDPKRAGEIVSAIKNIVSVPVSVKTRLGWSEAEEIIPTFLKTLEQSGVDLITIHARTKIQGYSGKANWKAISKVRECIQNIPLIINGDIVDVASAKQALEESHADGVMIGRGALGNPWIFQQISDSLLLQTYSPTSLLSLHDRLSAIREHARLQVEHYGEKGLIKLRKHLPWYFNGMPGAKKIRSDLVQISTLKELEKVINQLFTVVHN